MSTVIVFSKDRPMQIHGYLESLFKFSGCREEKVYVLYKEVLPIRYDKVKSYFPYVKWIAENRFERQLREIVAKADDYIMFGCDDVIFKDAFDFRQMENYLEENEDVFGFSLRLGRNIRPVPKKIKKKVGICSWNWRKNTGHYGYPWELDCTLYRKEDILDIFQKVGVINSPNYLESIPEEAPGDYIKRNKMASYDSESKAVVITINRVQDTHLNEVDNSHVTDVLSLYIKYQYENRFLDLNKIQMKKNRQVHVGSDFFVLTSPMGEDKRKHNKWYYFIQNLRLLGAGNFMDLTKEAVLDSVTISKLQDMAAWYKKPIVLTPYETVEKLLKNPKSFCRFGDGEFALMSGRGIAFQKYDAQLALILWQIFNEISDDIYVGVPYQHFETPDNFNAWIQEFYFSSGKWIRSFLYQHLSKNRDMYIDTGFNQVYQTYREMNFADYYEKVKALFADKKITIIAGEGILEKLEYDIFEDAVERDYILAPSRDAFSKHEYILDKVLQKGKERIICVILGPCSKVLVYNLTKIGYLAWDIGHLAKDYNAYRKRVARTKENIASFYAPD